MGLFEMFFKAKSKELEELKLFKNRVQELGNIEVLETLNLKDTIDNLNKTISSKEENIQNLFVQEQGIKDRINSLENDILKAKAELQLLDETKYFTEYGLYIPTFNFATSNEYKEALDKVRAKQKLMIKEGEAMVCHTEWTVNNSKREGKKMINNTIKIGLKSFNSDCDLYISKCKYSNVDRMIENIKKSFDKINELNKVNATDISKKYLELKLDELKIAYEFEVKKQEEKEILREEREKAREEAKLRKEIEVKTTKIKKELEHYSNALSVLTEKLNNELNEDVRKELELQIEEINKNIENLNNENKELDYRLENTGAGYVYIISNIGSFGKNVFKIGVTRRLDPQERIDELSSASVPFKFEINALIFNQEAYKLESYLHHKFDKYRINMANNRKEFFYISLDMIENELQNYGGLTFEFKKEFESKEYFETLKLKEMSI